MPLDGDLRDYTETRVLKYPALLRAAEIIEERGWCQGTIQNDSGEVCLLGGVYFGLQIPEIQSWRLKTLPAIIKYFYFIYKLKRRGITYKWNDTPERKKEEVIAALREAAYAP